jgi:hypothetical protein
MVSTSNTPHPPVIYVMRVDPACVAETGSCTPRWSFELQEGDKEKTASLAMK